MTVYRSRNADSFPRALARAVGLAAVTGVAVAAAVLGFLWGAGWRP